MANINASGAIKAKINNDNYIIYPITRIANVDGLQTALDGKAAVNHTHSAFSTTSAGFVPAASSSGDTDKYLKGDGTWATPSGGGGGDVSSIKMNNTSYTPDSNGVVNLGTVITSLSGYVPTSRTINGYDLSANRSLTYSDVGAAASSHTHSGYASSSHTHSNYLQTAYYTSNKTSGSLNDLSEGRVYCSSNCTNMPVSANMFVETMLDYNGSYKAQRAEVISGSYAGHVFSRYYNGSWSSWIDLTLNVPITLATSGNISSASIDLSSILTGTYLFTVTNNESGTNRYGCSLYILQKYDSGTIYVMKPVSEITNAKLSSYSFSGNTMSLSFDKSGYKTLRLICLYR